MSGNTVGKRCSMPEKVHLGGLQLWVTHAGVWPPLRNCGLGPHMQGQGQPWGTASCKTAFPLAFCAICCVFLLFSYLGIWIDNQQLLLKRQWITLNIIPWVETALNMPTSSVPPAGAMQVSVFSGLSCGKCYSYPLPAQGNCTTRGQRLLFLWRGCPHHSLQHSNSPGLLKGNYDVLSNLFQFSITHK